MQNVHTCPKCRSTDIVRIPGRARGAGEFPFVIAIGLTIFNSVKVTRYLCAGCGHIEAWADSAEDIAKVKKKYAGVGPT